MDASGFPSPFLQSGTSQTLWVTVSPDTEAVQIVDADVTLAHALHEVRTNCFGEIRPGLKLRHLLTEDETAHLVAEAFDLLGVLGRTKLLREKKEILLPLLCRGDPFLDEFYQNAVFAEAPPLRNAVHLVRDLGRETDTSPESFLDGHVTIVHQYGALRC